ncbi:NTP transferase domain-containing protein [bacterium]|nr:NTP transferase domain-containing protein [bacterium]
MSSVVVTVVQARRGSSRLPDKVLAPVSGEPLLVRMLERVRAARTVGTVVVATTAADADQAIVDLCADLGVACVRGDEHDLLDRHVQAARAHRAEIVVKIPSDCPLIDPGVIDLVIGRMLAHPERWDYVSNLHPATWPDGNDVEVMTMDALETAWRVADRDFEREHTTPFLWERGDQFRLDNVVWPGGRDCSMSHRFTIDYPEDLEFIRAVFGRLHPGNPLFSLEDILTLLDREPDIREINARYAGVNWYRHHLDELSTVDRDQTRLVE